MAREEQEHDKGPLLANILVAVNASKEIPKAALVWALTHIVQPGDTVALLAVISAPSQGRFWGLGCTNRHRRSYSVANVEEMSKINDRCSRMILQLRGVYDATKVNVAVKIVSGSPSGAVAAEAKMAQANWVVLDRLKHEKKHCLENLQCNVVVMKHSQPKFLRLNLIGSNTRLPEGRVSESGVAQSSSSRFLTPTTSIETFTATEGSDSGRRVVRLATKQEGYDDSESEYVNLSVGEKLKYQPWSREIFGSEEMDSSNEAVSRKRRLGEEATARGLPYTCNLRQVIALAQRAPPGPPPLCSVCKLKAPGFGHPPRWFTYTDLEVATAGFSKENFLAEGGYGSVHKGVLPDGLAIAVKQNKLASTQSDKQFCAEVEVLSRAQHRNVVMLVGVCIEDGRRLLVYEYICNGALDSHLYDEREETLPWSARQKIAVGAARGLRYLHEECRVGCIVHRDMRPNNILITHDFEPLVGDFGLARWQTDGQKGVDTKVLGTFGYLAPEYTQSGQITEKADVYSFGVVLMELASGLKAVDINRPRGQHCLTEWARPLLEAQTFGDLIDPRLGNEYSEHEVYLMLYAASLCLRKDPHTRPRMAQVLKILESHKIDPFRNWVEGIDERSQSDRMWSDHDQHVHCLSVTNESPRLSTKLLSDSARISSNDQ